MRCVTAAAGNPSRGSLPKQTFGRPIERGLPRSDRGGITIKMVSPAPIAAGNPFIKMVSRSGSGGNPFNRVFHAAAAAGHPSRGLPPTRCFQNSLLAYLVVSLRCYMLLLLLLLHLLLLLWDSLRHARVHLLHTVHARGHAVRQTCHTRSRIVRTHRRLLHAGSESHGHVRVHHSHLPRLLTRLQEAWRQVSVSLDQAQRATQAISGRRLSLPLNPTPETLATSGKRFSLTVNPKLYSVSKRTARRGADSTKRMNSTCPVVTEILVWLLSVLTLTSMCV